MTDDIVLAPIPHFIPGWIQLRVRCASPGGDLINTFSCTPPLATTRYSGAQLASLAEQFRLVWDASAKPLMGGAIKLLDVVASDLGDELGQTGTASWPANTVGTSTGEQLPANVALATTLRTKYRGPKYRGRSYLGGFTEAATNGDNMTSAFLSAIATLVLNVVAFNGGVTTPVTMVVASRKHQLLTAITSYAVTSIVDTMKRRLTTHGR